MNAALLFLCALCLLATGSIAGRIDSFSQSVQEANKVDGKIWAVLVAGSKGYDNYRHQSDVCHAYQVLKSHGVPDERIVVMMYDDIANHKNNPTPGVIVNHADGANVYAGVPKDFTGADVTPENFLKVLAGDSDLKKSGKKVLASGESDHVFIFFSDHGGSGVIAFPSTLLSATDLNKALADMHVANRFKRLVIYIEACEAGSMFSGLLSDDKNIYAVTASNAEESSYACYWDDVRGAYLGDEFSVNWMEDSDRLSDLSKETLVQQFDAVRDKTTQSHVSHYGNFSIAKLPVSQFQGEKSAPLSDNQVNQHRQPAHRDAVPSQDVPLIVAQRRAEAKPDHPHLAAVYKGLLSGREYVDSARQFLGRRLIRELAFPEEILSQKLPLTRHECYDVLLKTFDKNCFDVSTHPYALQSLQLLVNVCETLDRTSEEVFGVESIANFLATECKQHVQEHPFASIL